MKVLVVCQYYYPEPFRLPDICEALTERGHQVTVITGTPNYPEGEVYPGYERGKRRDEVVNGVRVHRCPQVPRKKGTICRFLNYYSFVVSSWWHLLWQREDFDLVFINQLSPVMMAHGALNWAKRNKKKSVLYCLDLWPESLLLGGIKKDSVIYNLFLKISRSIYRRADQLLVSSYGFLPYFADPLGLEPEKIIHLPQYAEDMFGDLSEAPGGKTCTDYVFAGNVGNAQSVETVVEAARLLKEDPSIHIHIVGGGISLDKCRELAAGLENITFHGRRPLEEMPAFYTMADGLIVTLIDDPNLSATLPGKAQSYMAAGKCLVAAANGETMRLIRETKCGLCAPAEDAAELASIMTRLAADPEMRRRYGENGRQYYRQHFTKDGFITTLERVLLENSGQDLP